MKKNNFRFAFILFILLLFPITYANALDLNKNPDVRKYIAALSKQYHFDQAQLTAWFNQVEFDPTIIASMNKPTEAKPWYVYRDIFVTPVHIQKGADYWRQHEKVLTDAENRYGVPAEIIVAIIGVESGYGTDAGKGTIPVMNSLATLAFNYPRRGSYFKGELTQFLLLSREQHWDPLSIKGSYAGAMGLPQFMPSSYRQYAVDADGVGKKDLLSNDDDAIASIANYLQKFGWQRNSPVAVQAKVTNNKADQLKNQNGQLHFTLQQLNSYGLVPTANLPNSLRAGVLYLDDKDSQEHWLTFNNFSVIKKYNNNNKYAMAVYLLGEAINSSKQQPPQPAPAKKV